MLNTTSNLYKTEWLNLVFKNRNQAYGAYALRSQSSRTSMYALFFGSAIFILVFMAPKIYSLFHKDVVNVVALADDKVVDVIILPEEKQLKVKKEVIVPKVDPTREKIKTVKPMTRPTPINDAPAFTPPTIEEMDHAAVGPVTAAGKETDAVTLPSVGEGTGTGAGTVSTDGSSNGNEVYNVYDIEEYPEFEGGMKAWYKFIQRNLRYPATALEQEKQGKVFISFVIERDGSVTDVKVMKGIGYGMDEEASRVIRKSPKWKPGKQAGNAVRVRFNMPISFSMGL